MIDDASAPAALSYRDGYYRGQDGLRLHYRDYRNATARGIPIVCLSGLTRNGADFHSFAQRYGSRHRIICPDYRGRGASGWDPDWRHYNGPQYLNDLHHLLTALDLHHVVVVGTSLGGILAMGLSVLHPTAIAGVILNDVGPDIDPVGSARILRYVGKDVPQPDWDAAVAHVKQLYPQQARSDAGWLQLAQSMYVSHTDGMLHYNWDTKIVRMLQHQSKTPLNLWPLFGALRPFPVLALRGGLSDVLSPSTFARMLKVKSDLIGVTIPEVGHVPSFEEPQVIDAVDRFLVQFQ